LKTITILNPNAQMTNMVWCFIAHDSQSYLKLKRSI